MIRRIVSAGAAGALLTLGALGATAGAATTGPSGPTGASGASGPSGTSGSVTGHSIAQARMNLEKQLQLRAARLANLVTDVADSKNLTVAHADLLNARLATEQADINGLIAKVPNDTTRAELNADSKAMYQDNRVFAVMSPQVFLTIGGDAVLAEDAVLTTEQTTLLEEVDSLIGEPGYHNALTHYQNFVRRITGVSTTVARVEQNVLDQTPSGYPGNTHVFVNANEAVLNATISLAYATYDASVIGLASGGYSGS